MACEENDRMMSWTEKGRILMRASDSCLKSDITLVASAEEHASSKQIYSSEKSSETKFAHFETTRNRSESSFEYFAGNLEWLSN